MFTYLKSFAKCSWWGIFGIIFMDKIVPLYSSFVNFINPETTFDKFLYPVSFGFLFYLIIKIVNKVNFYIDTLIETIGKDQNAKN